MVKSIVFLIVTTALAGLALYYAHYVRAGLRKGRGWPTTQGKILERGVGKALGRQTYAPHVKYSYTVEGKSYVSEQVYAVGYSGNTVDKVKEMVAELPDPITVHYNAQHPEQAFLLFNASSTYWIILLFGIGLSIAAAIQLLLVLTRQSK